MRAGGGLGCAPRHPDARSGEGGADPGEHLVRAAVGEQGAARREHDDPVDELPPHVDAVLDHDEGGLGALEHAGHGVPHLDHAVGIEVRGRLVEKEQAGAHGEHPREREALLLAAGELARRMAQRQVESDGVERLGHPAPDLVAWHPEVLTAERHVVPHPGEDDLRIRILQHQPHPAPGVLGGHPVDEKLPGLLPLVVPTEDPGKGVDERGLARARRPEEQYPLPRLDPQVQPLDGPRAAGGVAPAPAAGGHGRGTGKRMLGHGQRLRRAPWRRGRTRTGRAHRSSRGRVQ